MYLVGSRALDKYNLLFRQPNDYDLWATTDEIKKFEAKNKQYLNLRAQRPNKNIYDYEDKEYQFKTQIEIENLDKSPSAQLFVAAQSESQDKTIITKVGGLSCEILKPIVMYFLKRSHLNNAIHFKKHIGDYQSLAFNLVLNGHFDTIKTKYPKCFEAYKLRRKETDIRCKRKQANLNMSNDAFFGKSGKVKRYFEHDNLHKVIAFADEPMYLKCKTDKNKAKLDKKLFDKLSENDKEFLAMEEIFVIALERYIIPTYIKPKTLKIPLNYYNNAISPAYQLLCTRLTTGWFNDYLLDTLVDSFQMYDCCEKVNKAYKSGKLKRIA